MDYEDSKKRYFGTDSNVQFLLKSISKKANIFEEVLIFDETSLVGSLGGSLGLFIGFSFFVVTDRSSVLLFCPNRTEQVNQSSVSRTETEQNRTCKKRIEA